MSTISPPPFKSKFVLKLKDFKKINFNQINSKEGLDEIEVEMDSMDLVRNPVPNKKKGLNKAHECGKKKGFFRF